MNALSRIISAISWKRLHARGRKLCQQGRFSEAVSVAEKALGPKHPHVAISLNNLADLYEKMGRLDEVKGLTERAAKVH